MTEHITTFISRLEKCGRRYRKKRFESLGIRGKHYSYILTVCNNPGISQEQLGSKILIDKGNVARELAYLEEQGLIIRKVSDHDKRVTEVYPSEKAKELVPKIVAVLDSWNDILTDSLSLTEKETLINTLEKLSVKAREVVEEDND